MKKYSLLFALVLSVPAISQTPTAFLNVNHHTIVHATINGKGPYSFLLDTGSQSTLIDPVIASSWNLAAAGTVTVSGIGTASKSVNFVAVSVGVAGQSQNVRAIVYDLSKTQGPGDARVFGIIGQDFLEHFLVLIDYAHNTLTLTEAK